MNINSLTYNEGIDFIKNIRRYTGEQTGDLSIYGDISIHYPGYKGRNDYRLSINGGGAPSHKEISRILYTAITEKGYSFETMESFLEMTHRKGTSCNFDDAYLAYLNQLVFWVTLQEEINFPRSSGCAGINLAYCRYYEAIYSTRTKDFDIDQVYRRCDNRSQPKPPLYKLADPSPIYSYII
ncbi:MAG: hypothetical protein LIP16_06155 [Clostridium sp.]|nr:hypothetical protein [Clostridium sp.]